MRQIRAQKGTRIGQKRTKFNWASPLNRWEGGEIILGNGVNMGLVCSTESSFQYWSAMAGIGSKAQLMI